MFFFSLLYLLNCLSLNSWVFLFFLFLFSSLSSGAGQGNRVAVKGLKLQAQVNPPHQNQNMVCPFSFPVIHLQVHVCAHYLICNGWAPFFSQKSIPEWMDLTLNLPLQEKMEVCMPAQSKTKGWLKNMFMRSRKRKTTWCE